MKLMIAGILLLSSTAFAKEMKFDCRTSFNGQVVGRTMVPLMNQRSPMPFAKFESFSYFLAPKADGKIELQSFNIADPSRSYASASIKVPGDYVELSIWNNAYLMEVRCTLAN